MRLYEGPEAREWLQSNGHEAALASNRFRTTTEGLAFVEHLYFLGAKRVFIPRDSLIADEEELIDLGGPYSDTLVVELASGIVSPEIEALFRKEGTIEGFDREKDPIPIFNERFLVFWWD